MSKTLKPVIGFVISIFMFYRTINDFQYPNYYSSFLKSFGFPPTSIIGYLYFLIPAIFCIGWLFVSHSNDHEHDSGEEGIKVLAFIFVTISNNFWLNAPWIAYIGLIYAVIVLFFNFDNILRGANYMFVASPLERPAEKILEHTMAGSLDRTMQDKLISEVNEAAAASILPTAFPDVTTRKSSEAASHLHKAGQVVKEKIRKEKES